MKKLAEKKCIPCEGGAVHLTSAAAKKLLTELSDWELVEKGSAISKEFIFKNFDKAMDFVNSVADMAELENHHPDIHILYNKVTLELSTHAIGGLSENDFILAAKVDSIRL